MKPSVGAIHELPLPMVLAIAHLLNHTCIRQRQKSLVGDYNPLSALDLADTLLS